MHPDASVFFDIGANRGYTAAHIFGLWSPGHLFNGKSLFESINADVSDKSNANTNNIDTVCSDGQDYEPYVCIGKSQLTIKSSGSKCSLRRAIKVRIPSLLMESYETLAFLL